MKLVRAGSRRRGSDVEPTFDGIQPLVENPLDGDRLKEIRTKKTFCHGSVGLVEDSEEAHLRLCVGLVRDEFEVSSGVGVDAVQTEEISIS